MAQKLGILKRLFPDNMKLKKKEEQVYLHWSFLEGASKYLWLTSTNGLSIGSPMEKLEKEPKVLKRLVAT